MLYIPVELLLVITHTLGIAHRHTTTNPTIREERQLRRAPGEEAGCATLCAGDIDTVIRRRLAQVHLHNAPLRNLPLAE